MFVFALCDIGSPAYFNADTRFVISSERSAPELISEERVLIAA